MGTTEHVSGVPHPALAGLVRSYSGYRESSVTPLRRRQAPTGTCPIILSLGPTLHLDGPGGPSAPASFLAGVHDVAVLTTFTGEQHGLQVDLTPLGMFTLLGRPMSAFANAVPALDALEEPALAGLPGRLAEDGSWANRFARVDAVLLRMLDADRARPAPEVAWAWRRLVRTGGRAGVAELAAGTGWSRRHLLTRFREQVGLAPKAAGRVLRFERASGLLVAGAPSLADVAATCGYADQAHLAREFRALAGVTPSAFRAEFPFVQATGGDGALPSPP